MPMDTLTVTSAVWENLYTAGNNNKINFYNPSARPVEVLVSVDTPVLRSGVTVLPLGSVGIDKTSGEKIWFKLSRDYDYSVTLISYES